MNHNAHGKHRDPAPVVRDCGRLCEDLERRFRTDPGVLVRRICDEALSLLADLTLAVKGRDVDRHLEDADDRLIKLRAWIGLAGSTELLTQSGLLALLELCDAIGRQIGGWQRQRDQVDGRAAGPEARS